MSLDSSVDQDSGNETQSDSSQVTFSAPKPVVVNPIDWFKEKKYSQKFCNMTLISKGIEWGRMELIFKDISSKLNNLGIAISEV